MTVTALAAAPGIDRQAVDRQFTSLYAQHFGRLTAHIRFTNRAEVAPLAEDFAQETFMNLYRSMLGGLEVGAGVFGVLRHRSNQLVAEYARRKKNVSFKAVDLGDPVNTPIIATGHAYAAEAPELAETARDLDVAMDEMERASEAWRLGHRAKYRLRQQMARDRATGTVNNLSAALRLAKGQALVTAEQREAFLLDRFQDTCRKVAALRSELEREGGSNYQSSAGMPHSVAPTVRDTNRTHCTHGHELTVDNTRFTSNGRRVCRTCESVEGREANARMAGAEGRRAPGTRKTEQLALVSV